MPIKHRFVSAKPQGSDSSEVSANEWNDSHVQDAAIVAPAADTVIDADAEVVLATGGVNGITLTLPAVAALAKFPRIFKKTDSGAGPVVIAPAVGEMIDGGVNYALVDRYQYVVLIPDGIGWQIIGNN